MTIQLKYDDDFKNITRKMNRWNKDSDIPSSIKEYIKGDFNLGPIYDRSTKMLHCSNCLKALNENNYCSNCNIKYDIDEWVIDFYEEEVKENGPRDYYTGEKKGYYDSLICIVDTIKSVHMWDINELYYAFDIIDNTVFLYLIDTQYQGYNDYYGSREKNYQFEIKKVFLIEKNSITDLLDNQSFSFKELKAIFHYKTSKEEWQPILNLNSRRYKVYPYNLEKLKNTLYRYSYLWLAQDYIKKNEMTLEELILVPIYYPQFEYLIKLKLFHLAFHNAPDFQKGKSFKEIFGVDKKYLPLMVETDISYKGLQFLQIYPTTDIELFRFFNTTFAFRYYESILKKTNIDFKKLKDYITSFNLTSEYLNEYFDYLSLAENLGYNLKDKKVLYPKDFMREHNKLYLEKEVTDNPDINKKITTLASILAINKYEDNNYIIYPAPSIENLIKESEQQCNCVRTYCEEVANNNCQIYFMRKKENIDTSFVTIEVRNNKVLQARTKYNNLPDSKINAILNNWEKNLIPISNINEEEYAYD